MDGQSSCQRQAKLPYSRPRLTSYGDLQTLTKTKTGANNDSGTATNTKVPGS